MSLSLKITFGEDIRRFSVSRDISFSELRAFIEKHLGVSHLTVKYIDDEEELVTIGSAIEFEEAKRLQPDVLRLTVVESKSSQKIVAPVTEEKKADILNMCLVRDVTIADGSQVTVNTPFKKIWRLKNNGAADWPENVKLCLIGPDNYQLGGSLAGVSVRPIKVGQEVDVAVDLQAPKVEGRYVGYWKLMSGAEPFGARIWVDVNVVASKADEEETRRKQEAEKRRLEEEERCQREEAERCRREEEERCRREEEEAKRQEEERLRREEEERLRRQKEEEEERCRIEEEERLRREEEEKLRRQKEEEERKEQERLRHEEEERRKRAEEEERRRLEEEKRQAEEAAKRKAEEEAKLKAEEEAKRKAEEEAALAKLPFATQLKQLAEMGFTDQEKNRQLLQRCNGNVDQVVEALFMGQ